jgi:signal transduction histidine kinase
MSRGVTRPRPDAVRWSEAVRVAVEDRLFRALAVLRLVLLVNLIGLNVVRAENFDRPMLGVTVVLVLVAWTGVATWAYAVPMRRSRLLLLTDLMVALTTIAASTWVKGEDLRATVPGFWVMAPLLAWAVHWGWRGGSVAAVLTALADVLVRGEFTQVNYGNVFLLLIGGPLVGYVSDSLKSMAVERDEAQRAAAVATERARLARAVHDGVLQVLSMVQRQGADTGGEFAQLARLAGAQESALRALIRQQDSLRVNSAEGVLDLAGALEQLESLSVPTVHVAGPGHAVEVPIEIGRELLAVANACVRNIAQHVGADAEAWVLLEVVESRVILSVRDVGPGIPEGRLQAAAAEGRLGVVQSIRGRVVDLGGTAALSTGPWGTEWEFTVPFATSSLGAQERGR